MIMCVGVPLRARTVLERRLRSTTLKKLLATTRCGAAMADGVATIPSVATALSRETSSSCVATQYT